MKRMKTKSWLPILLAVTFIFFITPEVFSTTQFRVTVRGDQGQLIANALVTASGSGVILQAKSDAQGVAVFNLPNGTFKIEASLSTYAKPAVGTFGIPQQQTGTVVFPSNPVPFVVFVSDTNNKPVAGASVRVITAADNAISGTTGGDGKIQFSVPRGVVKSVDVTAPGFQPGNVSNVQVGQGGGVQVILKASATATQFRVILQDSSGKLVANTDVTITGPGVTLPGKTDAQGVAVFSLPNGTFNAYSSSPAYGKAAVGVFSIPQQQFVKIVFPPNLSVIKFVVYVFDNSNNKPVGGASVRVLTAANNTMAGTTGVDGKIEFSVPSGVLKSVDVTAPGFQAGNLSDFQVVSPTGVGYSFFLKSSSIEELWGPKITVISPKSGDVWTSESTQTIRWTYKGNPPGPDVKLALLDGTSAEIITLKTPIGSAGNGSYNWKPYMPDGNNYTIKIQGTTDGRYFGDSGKFSIMQPKASINIISPRAGDIWKEGSTQTIRWTYTNASVVAAGIGILYYGSTVAVIAKDLPGGSGVFNWVIPRLPSPLGDGYIIEIQAIPTAGNLIKARSASFTITK